MPTDLDVILDEPEGHCFDAAGRELPNARAFRVLVLSAVALLGENARLRADLLSARQFGQTMIPNPLLQRQPFADDPADRFKERAD